ncbi:GerMN domain-containing protein [Tenggerimyces flavus]|uniref:GerMN domain-containing protein n=1 Tax=Tenggerimyces flavus TaxID=1708749 RepID=A0ABV7YMX8_9ACTN|nr:GerMN domain-containing protein [Tenggerimyces flavus]MBM7790250.1 spore germination protein GerM [Tenggerimyces flavus]
MTTRRSISTTLLVGLCLGGLAACGVSVDDEPHVVQPTAIPNGLLDRSPSTPTVSPAIPVGPATTSYFLEANRLVAVRRPDRDGTAPGKLRRAIHHLLAGPTDNEQAHGLSTAIPSDLELTVVSLRDGRATIDLTGTLPNPPAQNLTLAVAQIVLTATAVSGVGEVQLTQQGETIEAPLVDGSLTAEPLTAANYQMLLAS